jgi:predicted membrane-bound spermidine synthase
LEVRVKARHRILGTAFLEGLAVLIVEIAGARALAPFYGTSLGVWTAQITATLLFLALGYALGGRLSRTAGPLSLPGVFWGAGLWLALYPWLRTPVLSGTRQLPGIEPGAFLASVLLFGPVLLGLGAVSPLLIQRVQAEDRGGEAAGAVFFINTLGGLVGGWLTALVLLPHFHLRRVLAFTGLGLVLLGSLWALGARRRAPTLGLPLLALLAVLSGPSPLRSVPLGRAEGRILFTRGSGVGLIQVLDIGRGGYSQGLSLLLDGITQGGMERETGHTAYEFTEYQNAVAWTHHPNARRALLLGLGPGMLAKSLVERGLEVDVAEIEPAIPELARRFFGLPDAVRVHSMDARAYLARSRGTWDLIFLDAFAGENVPWYLMTVEGLEAMRARLAPGGLLIINTITRPDGGSPGLLRLEAGLSRVFQHGRAYVDAGEAGFQEQQLVNACLVAGAAPLSTAAEPFRSRCVPYIAAKVETLLGRGRPLRGEGPPTWDDASDLDYADAGLRQVWRRQVLEQFGPDLLGD